VRRPPPPTSATNLRTFGTPGRARPSVTHDRHEDAQRAVLDAQAVGEKQPVDEALNRDRLRVLNHSANCTVRVTASGNISIVAKEPLSGEKMWVKRIEVSLSATEVPTEGRDCLQPSASHFQEWKKAHVDLFEKVMKSLDSYVNGEEFQNLKKQSAELRAKKVY
jgi:hypothetical protein